MSDLLIVTIKHFFDYCKNGCPFFEEDSNKHKYYCYIDGMLKNSINCYKKRIIFDDEIKDECYFKNIKNEQKEKDEKEYKDFSDGFSDCMNGKPIRNNANKKYIEGYSKAMVLKKDCDGDKTINNVLANNNNNNNLTNSNATTSSTTTIIT